MDQPEGFEVEGDFVCKLNKAIYGLKQAPRVWKINLKEVVGQIGFVSSVADPALYIRGEQDGSCTHLLTYVDDFLIACTNLLRYHGIVQHMRASGWDISELGFPKQFLSLDIWSNTHTEKGPCTELILHQANFITRLVESTQLTDAKPASTPMPANWAPETMHSPLLADNSSFASLIGSLLYIAICTRPDIAFAVNFLARYTSKPTQAIMDGAKRVVRYLKGTAKLGLRFSTDLPPSLIAYTDADYAGDLTTRRSTTGHVILLAGTPVVWTSKRQIIVAKSTSEAEYQALGSVGGEICWLHTLCRDMHLPPPSIPVQVDNQSCITWAKDWTSAAKAKHIDVLHHYTRELMETKKLHLDFVGTADQVADILTKALPPPKHISDLKILGMKECPD